MPKVEVKEIADFYEEEAQTYDDERFTNAQGKYMNEMQKDIVMHMVDCWKDEKVLDLGCGTGRFTLEIANRGGIVTALDPALSMLSRINEKVEKVAPDNTPDMVRGTGYALPFRDNTFDGCIAINVMDHLPYQDKVFKEVSRVVKQGGFFIMNFPNLLSPLLPAGLWINLRKRSLINDVYTQYFTLAKLSRDLRSTSFKIKVVKGNGLLPVILFPHWLTFLPNKMDRITRNSALKYIASVIFVKAESNSS